LQAAGDGDAARVQALLARGAPLEARDADGNTPLLRATLINAEAAASALIQAGADVNAKNEIGVTALWIAAGKGKLEILAQTLRHGADLRSTNRYGGTALIPACERGHVAVVQELLTRTDVNANHVNNLGWTALLEAVILGDGGPRYREITGLLIAAHADLNIADRDGKTALAHARARGFAEIANALVAAGAR